MLYRQKIDKAAKWADSAKNTLCQQKLAELSAQRTKTVTVCVVRYVTVSDVLWIEAGLDHLRCSPLRTHHHIVTRLVPEVVTHRRRGTVLPVSGHLESLSVQQQKTAWTHRRARTLRPRLHDTKSVVSCKRSLSDRRATLHTNGINDHPPRQRSLSSLFNLWLR